jgi:putative tryptophan/tyrosine transport system substrate-binding protein
VPIVFANVVDPVGSGLVASFAHPGGNATGFVSFEYALAAKWLELLKEIAPRVTRAAVLRETTSAAGIGQFAAIQTVGSIGMELSAVDMRDLAELERAVADFARGANGGLIVTASQFAVDRPAVIATLAARYKLPAIYCYQYFVSNGGLISYGPDTIDPYRRAAGYVDRILKGEKPADLPVQAPTKYELAINLKTAKALGLAVPDTLLARADEVRSKPSAFEESGYWCQALPAIRNSKIASPRSVRDCESSAGPRAATHGSTNAGAPMPPSWAPMRLSSRE